MSKKLTMLMILDGYGINQNENGNAISVAKTPVMDKLMKQLNGLEKKLKKYIEKMQQTVL